MSALVDTFRALHHAAAPLLLPNAWDAGSARLLESLGAPAVATTSAGVAWSLGYADGGALPVQEAVAAAARMSRVLKVPLSVDIEDGYSNDPRAVANTVMRLLDAGVAGINIEDGQALPAVLARKIEAIKNAAARAGSDIFVNARCDVFLGQLVAKERRLNAAIASGSSYTAAGADGLFIPAITAAEDIAAVTAELKIPLNIMVWPGLPETATLGQLGVRRLSVGAALARAAMGHSARSSAPFLATGNWEKMIEDAMPHAQLQKLFMEM